jgi:Uma2 family endonuclease
LPLCPDFVIELRSETDKLQRLQEKMRQYIENGAALGWLIDPIESKAYIYDAGSVQELLKPDFLFGDPFMPGFVLDLTEIW